jgi:hypothetical protein
LVPPKVPVERPRLSKVARGVGAPAVPRPVPRPEAPASPFGPALCWPRGGSSPGLRARLWPVVPALPGRYYRSVLQRPFFARV